MRFGAEFTAHQVSMTWDREQGWIPPQLQPYGPVAIDPAAAVLHYGQEILEGLKAYRHADGSIHTFRPYTAAERFRRSARRMAMPELPVELFVAAIDLLVVADHAQVPEAPQSLYLRPFMYASEAYFGVRPAGRFTFCLIASPAGAYFDGSKPVSLWLTEEHSRAGRGGTGAAKCGPNYAASLLAQQEARDHGCDQVLFADEGRVRELGAANVFLVYDDGRLSTPELDGTILEGITRDSVLALAAGLGHRVEERPIALDEWRAGVRDGRITEVFACGTAAAVVPVGRLRWNGGELAWGTDSAGPVTSRLRKALLDLQFGRAPDRHQWLHAHGSAAAGHRTSVPEVVPTTTAQGLGTVLP